MVGKRLIIVVATLLAAWSPGEPAVAQSGAPDPAQAQQGGPGPATSAQQISTEGDDEAPMPMYGQFGNYPATLESSGTSWQPQSSPMRGIHFTGGSWSFMLHGFATFAYGKESGPRGASEFLAPNMFMLRGGRPVGSGGFSFRVMSSLEPAMGPEGYPLLLQTGETADGTSPLIDRQHPHDLFMELSVTYKLPLNDEDGLFFYFAPVGEPALGPPTFMHRFSSGDNPQSPISHHMLDSSHITYGVLTFGFVSRDVIKIDASIFTGAEPDEQRWNLESPSFDSYSGRLSVNPTKNWAIQVSAAKLTEPEQIHAGVDVIRLTASAMHHRQFGKSNWQTTVAFGRNKREAQPIFIPPVEPAEIAFGALAAGRSTNTSARRPAHFIPGEGPGPIDPSVGGTLIVPATVQRGFLVESAFEYDERHTMFGRYDITAKDELFDLDDPRHGDNFTVSKLTFGYIFDAFKLNHAKFGLGLSGAVNFIPAALEEEYGSNPGSALGFLRIRLR